MTIGSPAPGAEPAPPPLTDSLSDNELANLALAADPDTQVGPEAVSLWSLAGWDRDQLLPGWYMPAPMPGRTSPRWQRWVIGLIVASFLVINAYGLCSTYGRVEFG
jgi:hypothetical protein